MNTPSECGWIRDMYGHEGTERACEARGRVRGRRETEGRDSWVWVVIGGIGDSDAMRSTGKRNRRARDVVRWRRE